ncbi:MAG: HD domain-containing protein, partial [Victivallaceae bacterium]|nr:HD domain-containing protein [Victivallaceae bacterium]
MLSDRIRSAIFAEARRRLEHGEGGHDYDHTLRVLVNARDIAGKYPNCDMDVLETSAILHDMARPEETASQGTLCHAQIGAEMALAFLLELDLS